LTCWDWSPNGAEFINAHLQRYCEAEEITFTRGRAYRKNDSCYNEQKNWSVIRQHTGYLRYDTDRELQVLRELYTHLRLLVNFFQPSSKLIEKTREGAKVRKRYDTAQTPCQRVLGSSHVSAAAKRRLTVQYATLNPAELRRHIGRAKTSCSGWPGSRTGAVRLRLGPPEPTTGPLELRTGSPRSLRWAGLVNEALEAPQRPVPNRGRHLATLEPVRRQQPGGLRKYPDHRPERGGDVPIPRGHFW
jgi:hypothetical protein